MTFVRFWVYSIGLVVLGEIAEGLSFLPGIWWFLHLVPLVVGVLWALLIWSEIENEGIGRVE